MAFWNTVLERVLIICLAMLMTIILFLTIAIVITAEFSFQKPKGNHDAEPSITENSSKVAIFSSQTCFTAECLQASSKIIQYMDPSIDPCDDFFQYACGGFEKSTILPDNAAAVTIIELSDYQMELELEELLDQPINPQEPRYVKLMKKYYDACTDKNAVERDSIDSLLSVLRKLGGWPVLEGDNWNETDFNWITTTYKAKNLALPFEQFLSVDTTDLGDGPSRKLLLRPPTHIHHISEALDNPSTAEEIYGNLLEGMVDIAEALGGDRERAQIELRDSLQLEIDMYEIIRNTYAPTRYLTTITKLEQLFPIFPWEEYINTILAPDSKLSPGDTLYYDDYRYLIQLNDLLNTTSKRSQANYFIWRIILVTEKYLNEKVHIGLIKYGKIYGDRKEVKYRWGECVADVIANFNEAFTALYAKHYLKNHTRENISLLVDDMKLALENNTDMIDWIDKDLRNNVINEVLNAKVVVGFPDELLSDESIDELYSDLEFDQDNYFKLYINLTRFKTKSEFKLLNDEYATNFSWLEEVPKPNTNFRRSSKYLTINVGTLRPGDFFNGEYPSYLNFGAIGSWILSGMLQLNNYYKTEVYKNRSECFTNQYEKFIRLNPYLLNFHISEECALKEAYLAYTYWAKNNEPEQLLPGLDHHNPEQLFWLSLANSKCIKARPQYERIFNALNERLTNKERVNFAAKNSKYFGEIFKCPVGAIMNPKEKCAMY